MLLSYFSGVALSFKRISQSNHSRLIWSVSLFWTRQGDDRCVFAVHAQLAARFARIFFCCAITFRFALLFCIAINFLVFVQSTSTSIWNIKAGSNFFLVPNFSSLKLWNIKANLFFCSCQTFQTWTKILEVVLKFDKLLHCCTDNLDSALISPNFTGSWNMLLKNCGPS